MPSAVISKAKEFGHAATYVMYSRLLAKRSFAFKGSRHLYFYHRYNSTCENERCVEIPIALEFLGDRSAGAILEVGNVLNHYAPFQHTVVDKYEVGDGVANVDVCDFDPVHKYDVIVSISTIEHVGWDEEPLDSEKALRAIERLRRMLLPGGSMLISFPIGHNAGLDRAVRSGSLACRDLRAMKRTIRNNWIEISPEEMARCCVESPYLRGSGRYRRTRIVVFAYF